MGNQLMGTMLYLDSIDGQKDVYLYINSMGGDVVPTLAIQDTMQVHSFTYSTPCTTPGAHTHPTPPHHVTSRHVTHPLRPLFSCPSTRVRPGLCPPLPLAEAELGGGGGRSRASAVLSPCLYVTCVMVHRTSPRCAARSHH